MIKKSDALDQLAAALSSFQGEVTDAVKDTQGYGYKYAQLSGVLEISRPLLIKHGLSVAQGCDSQVIHNNDEEKSTTIARVETLLMHKSGQWISSEVSCVVHAMKGGTPVQALGAVITYLRRYSYTAMLGITQIDNDGADTAEAVAHTPKKPTTETHAKLLKLINDFNIKNDVKIIDWMKGAGVTDFEKLSQLQAAKLIGFINSTFAQTQGEPHAI